MGFLDFLFGQKGGVGEALDKLSHALQQELPNHSATRIEFLAALAGLFGEVAFSDLHISAEELSSMRGEIQQLTKLGEQEVEAIVASIQREVPKLAGKHKHLYIRRVNKHLSKEERVDVLHALFSIAGADDNISGDEERELRRLAEGLKFSHREFTEIRASYRDKRSVLKGL